MNTMIPGVGSIGSIPHIAGPDSAQSPAGESFDDVLKGALQQVNQLSGDAEQKVSGLLRGSEGDISGVMVAVEKADVAFQLMMQVRNKIVTAYQDIEKMQF